MPLVIALSFFYSFSYILHKVKILMMVYFSKAFDSIRIGANASCIRPSAKVSVIMMFYKNTKEMVGLPYGDSDSLKLSLQFSK